LQDHAFALTLALATALPAVADAPRVAADIPPVHSLVARVMQGVGEPALILPPGASPHVHAMRPSQAGVLADAEVLVWMGEALTPWLRRAVETLSPEAMSVALLSVDGTSLLGYRTGAAFQAHDHAGAGSPGEGARGAARGATAEAAGGAAGGETRGETGAERGGETSRHGGAGVDPHAWLDPENAKTWLDAIAAALSEADPGNAEVYGRNAAEGRAEIDALAAEITQVLDAVRGTAFIVFHDAYHYFEHRFGVEAAGAIALGDAAPAGAGRIAEVREAVRNARARCVFAEPQFPTDLIETVVEGTDARAATLDPVGAALEPGPGLYPQLLRGIAHALRGCLGRPG
jgi:zinc transport system substrate-binding protein